MSLSIQSVAKLNTEQFADVRALHAAASASDGFAAKLYYDCMQNRQGDNCKDFLIYQNKTLIAYLGAFEFKPKEFEITAIVHPEHRQKRLLARLLNQLQVVVEAQGIRAFNLPCHRNAEAAVAIAKRLHGEQVYSEYSMALYDLAKQTIEIPSTERITLIPAEHDDIPHIAMLDQICFDSNPLEVMGHLYANFADPNRYIWMAEFAGEKIGKMHVTRDDDAGFIHDFCVLPQHQGKHLGTEILRKTLRLMQNMAFKHATLDVKCNNQGAIRIYEHAGFITTSVYDFYLTQIADFYAQDLFHRMKK